MLKLVNVAVCVLFSIPLVSPSFCHGPAQRRTLEWPLARLASSSVVVLVSGTSTVCVTTLVVVGANGSVMVTVTIAVEVLHGGSAPCVTAFQPRSPRQDAEERTGRAA